jgi:hypothetical protein
MDLIFFADQVYDSLSGIMKVVFTEIYSDFSTSVRVSLNAVFHFFIVFYAFMALRTGIVGSLLSIARTILLLLITFNLSFNFEDFKSWIYDFVMEFPVHIAGFFVNSTISSLIPGFRSPESFNTSRLFAQLCTILLNRAKASWEGASGFFSISPAAIYLVLVVIFICILYFAYWLIQFNFLMQASIYMIIGVPILLMASFKQTQSIFFEWARAMITLMLYPIFASIVIFIIINVLLPLSGDSENIINDSHVGLSTIGTIVCTVVFGIYAMRQIPAMAAVLTRGHMTAGNPIGFAMNAARSLREVGQKMFNPDSPLIPKNTGRANQRGSGTSGSSGKDDEKKIGFGDRPSGAQFVGGAKSENDKSAIRQRAQIGYDPSIASKHQTYGQKNGSNTDRAGSVGLQSTPSGSITPVSEGPSSSQVEKTDTGPPSPTIELKPQGQDQQAASGPVPTYGEPSDRITPPESKDHSSGTQEVGPQNSTSRQQSQNIQNQGNREGEKTFNSDNSGDRQANNNQQSQNISSSEDRSQSSQSSFNSEASTNNQQTSLNQSSNSQTHTRSVPESSRPPLISQGPPASAISSDKQTQRDTVHTESQKSSGGGSPSILPKVTPPRNPPTSQSSPDSGKKYEPKADVKK